LILTSNRGWCDWNQVFPDQVVAGAVVDRLLHNATVLNIRAHGHRKRAHQPQGRARHGQMAGPRTSA
jgi:DNA replication protein DnaC